MVALPGYVSHGIRRRVTTYRAVATRASLYSNVWTWPVGATVRASDVVRDPLPVPVSITTLPGLRLRLKVMTAMSTEYTICVRWASAVVHSSGDGLAISRWPTRADRDSTCHQRSRTE